MFATVIPVSASTTSLKFVPGFYAGPRGWCLKASRAGRGLELMLRFLSIDLSGPTGRTDAPSAVRADELRLALKGRNEATRNELQGRRTSLGYERPLRFRKKLIVRS